MERLGYYNGEYGSLEEMKVPMLDRASFFGDGVYDATCAVNHNIFLIDEHIDRYFNSAGLLKIVLPFTKAELKEILIDMVNKVDGNELMVYWQQTRGTADRNHAFPDVKSNLWIMIKPIKLGDLTQRIDLTSIEDTRFLHCNIKTLNLIPSVLASQKAELDGCAECVFHRGEIVTECAHSNVSILKDGIFKSHPNDNYVLPGIAKAHLIKACHALNIPVEEKAFTMDELRDADEVIVSSSTKFCSIAKTFEGKAVGGKATALVDSIQRWVMDEFNEYCDYNY